MARLRWAKVSATQRSRLARAAALARWAKATARDRAEARARAARARQTRTRIHAARLLGVDPADLAGLKVQMLTGAEFRRRKSREQARHWAQLRKGTLLRTVSFDPNRASGAPIIHPQSFRMSAGAGGGK